MYGIGEVARASGLGVSALRFYDRAAVLVPAEVDPVTGYRRYSGEQIRAARLIAGLRRVDLPVVDIGRAVAELRDGPAVRKLLDEHLRRLEDGLADARRELSRIHRLLDLEENTLTRISLPAAALAAALDAVRFAAGTDPRLPMINGVLFEAGPEGLTVVATDRYRLAVAEAAGTAVGPPVRVVAPLTFVDELRAAPAGTVTLDLSSSAITAGTPTRELAAEPLDVDFPDHRRLTRAAAPAKRITVDVPALRTTLGGAATVTREHEGIEYDVAILTLDPSGAVRVADEDAWAADEQAHVAVNREFLLQALDAGGGGQLVLELDGPIGPLAVRGTGTYSILMPVRL
ncbi:DNA polymerase III subunit beta family protein [Couchioplanes caeruleus]|uniref:MerR family transcriptional regulator n=2 Tax=Couchioplanes caeruleus TaxID=56438 RepID=A0A1K0FKN8_9ACTN|nr:MerR family transcriptional regulator [Couchioplanes caeruleus]OJF13421.1 MerR family transcriptional regulator [Couchioplanes caeruleus subsp. caeruleus]ROP32102.1 MerR-like DNA binding protein [Couchioplanes caeruleus]